MAQTIIREPIEFTAGDTLAFMRYLPDFLPSDGWSLLYVLRGDSADTQFTSTTSGSSHAISVSKDTTATWAPGEYILIGYAVKSTTERHQIYYGQLQLNANFPATQGDEPVKTFAQKMVEALETELLARAEGGGMGLVSSQIGETRFQYQTEEEIRSAHGYWVMVRNNEIKIQRAKAGLPTGDRIKSTFRVTPQGQFWGLPPWFCNGF